MHYTKKVEKLLLKVKNHILEEPRRYSQSTWGQAEVDRILFWASRTHETIKDIPPCHTVCCLAGWVTSLGAKIPVKDFFVPGKPRSSDIASELLGLTPREANQLFSASASSWPLKYAGMYRRAKTHAGRARAAARFIDAIIRTKGEIIIQHAI